MLVVCEVEKMEILQILTTEKISVLSKMQTN